MACVLAGGACANQSKPVDTGMSVHVCQCSSLCGLGSACQFGRAGVRAVRRLGVPIGRLNHLRPASDEEAVRLEQRDQRTQYLQHRTT